MTKFLPDDYAIPASNTFMRLENGSNKIRVLSPATIGFEYWTEDNKPIRSKKMPKETPNIRIDKNGVTDSIKHFWAFVVWDYRNKQLSLLEISQKSIMKAITELLNNPEWGDITTYDIDIKKTGSGMYDTKYTVFPTPAKELSKEILEAYQASEIDPEDLFNDAN